jgi:hypothetical protein
MGEQMSFGLIITDPQAYRIQSMQKGRKCLSCSQTFQSAGPGNRICNTCKDRDVWKAGVSELATVSKVWRVI